MICPNCQSITSASENACAVCDYPIRSVTTSDGLSLIPQRVSSKKRTVICPSCQSFINPEVDGEFCPACDMPLVSVSTPSQESRKKVIDKRPVKPTNSDLAHPRDFRNYGSGIIIGEGTPLQDEPRDPNYLQSVVAIILLLELVYLLVRVSTSVLAYGLLAAAIILALGGGAALRSTGCILGLLIRPIMALISPVFRILSGGIMQGNDPNNMRKVTEYRLNLMEGDQDTFIVKGNLSPRNLQQGDTVQINTVQRNGRPYFQSGRLETADSWKPLQISESSKGRYWVAGLIIFNLVLAFIYFYYLGG